MVLAFNIQAQDRTVTRTLSSGQTLYDYTGVSADTISPNQDTVAYVFNVNKTGPVAYSFETKISQNGLGDDETYTVDIKLFGKVFSTDSWTNVDVTNTGVDVTGGATTDITNATDQYREFKTDTTAYTVSVKDSSESDTRFYLHNISYKSGFHYRYFKVQIAQNSTGSLEASDYAKVDHVYLKLWLR